MKITVNDKKLSVNEWTRDRIEHKLTKLDRYFKADAEAFVKLSEERGIYKAEVTVNAGRMVYRAQEKSGDVAASFDAAVDAIDRQIRKNKTHLEKRLRSGAFDNYSPMEPEPEQEKYDVIRVKRFDIRPMTVDEAILQMNMLNHKFYSFKNSADGERFCVVYKREDGGYGLIESE
ncbi:MAG: ribosome-associated translation inhibitor RaiA [Clostridia bacterium]|nr:ribosome-associated translation inhibitor RaiA [Clostridia bacterium]